MPKLVNVYLSGPMYLGLEHSTKWRNEIKEHLEKWERQPGHGFFVQFNIFDPCARYYDDKKWKNDNSAWIVKIDKMEIVKSDVLIVNTNQPGWGTPMEQYYAFADLGKFVIAFNENEIPPIWVKEHSHIITKTHIEAADALIHMAQYIKRMV